MQCRPRAVLPAPFPCTSAALSALVWLFLRFTLFLPSLFPGRALCELSFVAAAAVLFQLPT